MSSSIQNVNNQGLLKPQAKGASPEVKPNNEKTQELFAKKSQAETVIDTLEVTATNDEGSLTVSTAEMDKLQAQAKTYASEAQSAEFKVGMAETTVAKAETDCQKATAQVQQLDAQIAEQTKGIGGFFNAIGNLFTGAIDKLKEQREVAAEVQANAENTKTTAENTKTQYERQVQEAEKKKTEAERNYEKQKQISESIEKKIAETKAKIGDKEMEIDDYENAIREAMKEQNCKPTEGTIQSGAAALYMADQSAKEQGKNTSSTQTSNIDSVDGEGHSALTNVAGDLQTSDKKGEGESSDSDGTNTAGDGEILDENTEEISPDDTKPIVKDKPKNDSVLDGVVNDLTASDKSQKDETENTEEGLQNDPVTDMSEAQAEQTVAIKTTQAKYEEAGISIDIETIKNAITSNNTAALDVAAETAVVQSAIKSTGRVMLGRGFGITTKKESKENSEATTAFLDARASLNRTYSDGKDKSRDIRVEGFLNTTETIQSNITNGDTYSTSDLKGYASQATAILAEYDTTRQVTADTQGVSMKYEHEKTKTQELLSKEEEKFASDDKMSGKVEDMNIEFITVDYRYRNSASAIEQMSLTKDMTNIFQNAQKLELERVQDNSEAQAA